MGAPLWVLLGIERPRLFLLPPASVKRKKRKVGGGGDVDEEAVGSGAAAAEVDVAPVAAVAPPSDILGLKVSAALVRFGGKAAPKRRVKGGAVSRSVSLACGHARRARRAWRGVAWRGVCVCVCVCACVCVCVLA